MEEDEICHHGFLLLCTFYFTTVMVQCRHHYLMPVSFSVYCCRPFTSSHCVRNICFKFCATHSLQQCLNFYIVAICLKLPNSQLQYFIHSSISMNPSQGIYGGLGAGLVNYCYKFIQLHSPHLLKSYTQS